MRRVTGPARDDPQPTPYRSSDRADWGAAFACDSTVEAACDRICDRVSFDVSSAKSVSRIALSAALAYWAMSMVNRSISALTTALGTTATPLVGIASAAILLGEPIDASLAVAATLIIAGISLATLSERPSGQATASGRTRSAPRKPAAVPSRMPATAMKEASASVDSPVSP